LDDDVVAAIADAGIGRCGTVGDSADVVFEGVDGDRGGEH
jgi:hypothetical protein